MSKTFALALGGGGARGLAHIAVLEALDEIGARPSAVAGTLTYRFGSAMRSCSSRADATVPSRSRARSGATSIET